MNQQPHTRHRDRRTCPPCPECQSHNTRKVTLLYEAGTHHTATRGHYVNIGGYPSGGVYRGSQLTVSLLAQRLAHQKSGNQGMAAMLFLLYAP